MEIIQKFQFTLLHVLMLIGKHKQQMVIYYALDFVI